MNINVDLIADKLKKLPEDDKRNIRDMQLAQKGERINMYISGTIPSNIVVETEGGYIHELTQTIRCCPNCREPDLGVFFNYCPRCGYLLRRTLPLNKEYIKQHKLPYSKSKITQINTPINKSSMEIFWKCIKNMYELDREYEQNWEKRKSLLKAFPVQ